MSVGNQATNTDIDNTLTNLTVNVRELMAKIVNLSTQVNGTGQGLAYLESIGYSAAANPANPGEQSDAAWALQVIAYLNTVAGCYYGTVRQGGDGSAGSATTFNFNNALAQLWQGR